MTKGGERVVLVLSLIGGLMVALVWVGGSVGLVGGGVGLLVVACLTAAFEYTLTLQALR